ncbi:unnamed protein product, partial [Prunus brigantina]
VEGQSSSSNLEDVMKQFMQSQTATNPKNAQDNGEIKSTLSKLTSSLSIQEKGKFPSQQLGLGELKPNSVTLQLVDCSVKIPRGMVEDVLVQVQEHNGWVTKYEELPIVSDDTKSSREEAPRCELKPLRARLKYAFLGEEIRPILW